MKEITFTAQELHLLQSAVGISNPRNLADMVNRYKIYEWLAFSEEEKAIIGWRQTDNPDGTMQIRFTANAEIARECENSRCQRLVRIVQEIVPVLRVDTWPILRQAMLKLGWEGPDAV